MLVPIDHPLIDAGDMVAARKYSDPANGFTIAHENSGVVWIDFTSGVQIVSTSSGTAIADGAVVGQKLRLLVTSSGAALVLFTLKNSANTRLLGDWALTIVGVSMVPAWMSLVWDGADWLAAGKSDGSPAEISGGDAHAEGNDTTASGAYAHAEGKDSTASANSAHAGGSNTLASGDYSHAGGDTCEATDARSRATGRNSWARLHVSGHTPPGPFRRLPLVKSNGPIFCSRARPPTRPSAN